MTDPLTIFASVLAISGAAIRSLKALFDLVDGIKGAPEEIKSISKDARSLYTTISSLNATLEDAKTKEVLIDDDAMLEMIKNLTSPLSNCETVLAELVLKMQKPLKVSSDNRGDRMSTMRVRWALFIKGEARSLQFRLEAAKSTLNTALNGISVYGVFP